MSRTKTEKDEIVKKMKLPNELIGIPNSDKSFHESWYPSRNPLNIPHPFRGCLIGPPGVGKSNTVKNLLLRAKPAFKHLYIIHCDPDGTSEYSDVGGIFLKDFPSPESWEGKEKTLVVVDDIDLKNLSKDQLKNFSRLAAYCSTHKQISLLVCNQDAFAIPSIIRR
jgi:hypothetical protein